MLRNTAVICAVAMLGSAFAASDWEKDVGKPAPALTAAGWVGQPVSLESVRGNTTVLAFWNGDVAC